MAVFSALAGVVGAVSAVAGIAGTVVSYMGAKKQAKAQEKAEELRKLQLNVESTRARRQAVRESIVARSQAMSNATAQGAEGGSGIQGGMAQISGQAASNIQGVNQGQTIGLQMFDANKEASRGASMQATGQAITGFGSWLSSSYEQFSRTWIPKSVG